MHSEMAQLRQAGVFIWGDKLMRILVLGAAGFIGRRLVAALAAEPWAEPIAAIHRRTVQSPGELKTIRVDSTSPGSLTAAISDTDAVVNCVTGDGGTIATGARVLFECARSRSPPPMIVHLSTMSVYGSATGLVDETAPLREDIGWYGLAKIQAERQARDYAACGASVVILRPGCVYGPGSYLWTQRIAALLRQGRLGDLGAAGDGHCNLVYIDDVVQAAVRSLRTQAAWGQTFNLADPQAQTWNWYFSCFARALGAVPVARISARRVRFEGRVLAPPLKLAQIMCAKLGLRSSSFPPELMPPSLIRLFGQDIVLECSQAERILAIRWTPIADGLRRSAER